MTKRHVQHNGVWIYEVTLDPSPTLPRAVPEAKVIRCYSPDAMAQWLTVVGAPWTAQVAPANAVVVEGVKS